MKKIAIFAAIMVVGAGVALASTLQVPFFLDTTTNSNGTVGTLGRIGIKEAGGVDQTVTVIYTALNSSDVPTDQTATFALGANQQVRWFPVQANPNESAAGAAIDDMAIAGPSGNRTAGSALVIGSAALSGQYSEVDLGRSSTSMHVLLPAGL